MLDKSQLSHSSLSFSLHHFRLQCVAVLDANKLQNGLSSASSVASSTQKLLDDWFVIVISVPK